MLNPSRILQKHTFFFITLFVSKIQYRKHKHTFLSNTKSLSNNFRWQEVKTFYFTVNFPRKDVRHSTWSINRFCDSILKGGERKGSCSKGKRKGVKGSHNSWPRNWKERRKKGILELFSYWVKIWYSPYIHATYIYFF